MLIVERSVASGKKRRRSTSKANGKARANGARRVDTTASPTKHSKVPGCYGTHALDRAFKAIIARLTNGISPAGMTALYVYWLVHLAMSPGKQLQLMEKATRKSARLGHYASQSATQPNLPPCIEPLPQDRRFSSETWRQWPYNLMYHTRAAFI